MPSDVCCLAHQNSSSFLTVNMLKQMCANVFLFRFKFTMRKEALMLMPVVIVDCLVSSYLSTIKLL